MDPNSAAWSESAGDAGSKPGGPCWTALWRSVRGQMGDGGARSGDRADHANPYRLDWQGFATLCPFADFRFGDLGVLVLRPVPDWVSQLPPQAIDDVVVGCVLPNCEYGSSLARMVARLFVLSDARRVTGVSAVTILLSGLNVLTDRD